MIDLVEHIRSLELSPLHLLQIQTPDYSHCGCCKGDMRGLVVVVVFVY